MEISLFKVIGDETRIYKRNIASGEERIIHVYLSKKIIFQQHNFDIFTVQEITGNELSNHYYYDIYVNGLQHRIVLQKNIINSDTEYEDCNYEDCDYESGIHFDLNDILTVFCKFNGKYYAITTINPENLKLDRSVLSLCDFESKKLTAKFKLRKTKDDNDRDIYNCYYNIAISPDGNYLLCLVAAYYYDGEPSGTDHFLVINLLNIEKEHLKHPLCCAIKDMLWINNNEFIVANGPCFGSSWFEIIKCNLNGTIQKFKINNVLAPDPYVRLSYDRDILHVFSDKIILSIDTNTMQLLCCKNLNNQIL